MRLSRAVARRADRGALLQRRIAVTLPAYAKAVGIDEPEQLTRRQLSEYMRWAVLDDYTLVYKHAREAGNRQQLKQWRALMAAADENTRQMDEVVDAVNDLVRSINEYWDGQMAAEVWDNESSESGRVPLRNSQTRYATNPSKTWSLEASDYQHTNPYHAPSWDNDVDMWAKFGDRFARLQERLPEVSPRGPLTVKRGGSSRTEVRLELPRLRWQDARTLLPRPLMNLLFDVRYQLESGDGSVIDERSQDEQERKKVTPNDPGALRSWHTDSPQLLPANEFDSDNVPEHARALHGHYTETSAGGSGSSQGTDGTPSRKPKKNVWKQKGNEASIEYVGPIGYAEYTGTGSNSEHNTKIVLDYIGKRVYLTLTHYFYWALLGLDNGTYEAWNCETQDLTQATGKLKTRREQGDVSSAVMMSPWVEIVMPGSD